MTGLNRAQEIGGGFPPEIVEQPLAGLHFSWWLRKADPSVVLVGLTDASNRRGDILRIDLAKGVCLNQPEGGVKAELPQRLPQVVSFLRGHKLPTSQ